MIEIDIKEIPVEVKVIGDRCRECPAMDIEKVNLAKGHIFKCKNLAICMNVIYLFNEEDRT